MGVNMKNYTIILSIFLVIGMLGSIRFLEDNDYTSDIITLHANVRNRQSNDTLENVRVRMLVLENGGTLASSGQSNIKSGDVGSKIISTDLYGNALMPGENWVRIYAYDENGNRDIKHRMIIVQ